MSRHRLSAILALGALAGCLVGCGYFGAQQSFAPEFLRAKKPPPELPDPEPDAMAFVKEHINEIFAGEVSDIRVGKPRPIGLHWEFCVASLVKGITGMWAETTIILEINHHHVGSRRRATSSDDCDLKTPD